MSQFFELFLYLFPTYNYTNQKQFRLKHIFNNRNTLLYGGATETMR